jgi:hypothetical protein
MARFDHLTEVRDWLCACEDAVRLLDGEPAALARRAPSVSAWSPVEHVAHVTLANELVLRNLRNLGKGSGMLVVTEAQQLPAALARLAAGALPRGEARSPRMVVPPADVDLATARDWARKLALDLAAFTREVPASGLPRCYVPHQVLGPLDFAEWARFGAVHTRHHLAIAREALAAR